MIRSITVTTLLALLAGLALTATSHAAPKRVVALEWDALENLLSLGVKPVGAADTGTYRTYVAIGLPGGITDVGKRQEPSIERIARLKPDLIVVPSNRAGRNLRTLRKISRVLVTNPYPGDTGNGAQWGAMVRDFRAIARAVGQRARGENVLRGMSSRISRLRASIRKRAGTRVTIATPGGTTSSPALRLFTSNSIAAEVVRRLGLRNAWTARPQRFGFSTVGVEALRQVQSGWLAFVYPRVFAAQVGSITRQSAYKRLDMVKKRRVKTLSGNTWLFGGPASARVFAERLTNAMR
jgi:ABC-type Fe3+-hydroxamate transport system substrate-binding protein